MKLQQKTGTGQFFINLPKSLVLTKKWQKGQILDLRFNERGNIELFEIQNQDFGMKN